MDKNDTSPIRAARIRRKLSQQALAAQVGVTKATVSKWETGRAHPNTATAHQVAKVLRIRLEAVYALPVARAA